MSDNKPQVKIGEQIGPCIVRELLGRGRNTAVYRAFYPALKQEVALKILQSSTTPTAEMAVCFKDDMQPIAQLKHPNIMRIFDVGSSENQYYYIIMELVEGTGLRDLISTHLTGLGRDEYMRIFSQLASAVATAHDQNVVHGNLKPDNVLLDVSLRPVLTDFSIPCLQEHRSDRGWLGAPAYLAPEQAASGQAMIESDIYALGILLYEMVTGDVPFKGGSYEAIIQQHQHDDPTPPSQIKVGLDPRIERVILNALNKAPMARYSSARAMLVALENEDVKSQFSTVSLNRKDMPDIKKRQSEIRRFEQARLDDQPSNPRPSSRSLFSLLQNPVVMGVLILLAIVVIVLAVVLVL